MLVVVLIAFVSRPYRRLSRAYAETPPPPAAADATEEGDRPGHSVRSRTAA
jgi:MFS transporter, DHA3 family, multidrug efflux protein